MVDLTSQQDLASWGTALPPRSQDPNNSARFEPIVQSDGRFAVMTVHAGEAHRSFLLCRNERGGIVALTMEDARPRVQHFVPENLRPSASDLAAMAAGTYGGTQHISQETFNDVVGNPASPFRLRILEEPVPSGPRVAGSPPLAPTGVTFATPQQQYQQAHNPVVAQAVTSLGERLSVLPTESGIPRLQGLHDLASLHNRYSGSTDPAMVAALGRVEQALEAAGITQNDDEQYDLAAIQGRITQERERIYAAEVARHDALKAEALGAATVANSEAIMTGRGTRIDQNIAAVGNLSDGPEAILRDPRRLEAVYSLAGTLDSMARDNVGLPPNFQSAVDVLRGLGIEQDPNVPKPWVELLNDHLRPPAPAQPSLVEGQESLLSGMMRELEGAPARFEDMNNEQRMIVMRLATALDQLENAGGDLPENADDATGLLSRAGLEQSADARGQTTWLQGFSEKMRETIMNQMHPESITPAAGAAPASPPPP